MVRHARGKVWPGVMAASAMLAAVACDPGKIGAPGRGLHSEGAGSGTSITPGGGRGGAGTGAGGTGSASKTGSGDPGDPGNPGDPGSTGGSAPSIEEEAAQCANTPVSPGPSFVRRLNRFEYANTVRDLLGVTDDPTDQFPSEEKRLGFDNNATALQVSPALVEQYQLAAESLSTKVVPGQLARLVPCDASGGSACAVKFISAFGQKAYRRPLSTDEASTLKGVFDVGAQTDFNTGVKLVVQTVLQSAPFLYRVEFGTKPATGESVVHLTSWEMASRLSYLLWQSMPDDQLYAAAAADKLVQAADIEAQVTRMMSDPKAHDVVAHFHEQWLQLEKAKTVEKDAKIFPTFKASLVPLMEEETRRFLDYTVWDGEGTLEALLTSDVSFMNGPLAAYYGVPGVTGNDFVKVTLDADSRPGILTRGGIMAMLGKANQTDPVHRGKFVREQLLCDLLPPPPADIMIKPPELDPKLSTRERFTQHRTDPVCSNCHSKMDPIGFGFEHYDGAGLYRATENGQAIDATGQVNSSDIAGTFDGATDLAHRLAGSDEVRKCVTTSWFRYAYGRAETKEDSCTLARVTAKFADADFDIKTLVSALATTDAFLYRKVIPAGGDQ